MVAVTKTLNLLLLHIHKKEAEALCNYLVYHVICYRAGRETGQSVTNQLVQMCSEAQRP